MLFREIIGLFWESYKTRKKNSGQNEELFNIKAGGIHSYHLALEG
jgi:hypothetical protein